jgi:hypothetical protein
MKNVFKKISFCHSTLSMFNTAILVSVTSRYDSPQAPDTPADPHESIPFQNPFIIDIEYRASSNELRAAGFRPPKRKAGGHVDTPHDRMTKMNSERTVCCSHYFFYLTLFLYGIGGPCDSKRPIAPYQMLEVESRPPEIGP